MSSQNHDQATLHDTINPPGALETETRKRLTAPTNSYYRKYCLRLVLPWQHEEPTGANKPQRPTDAYGEKMEKLLESVSKEPLIECVEQLLFPGEKALEIILNPIPAKHGNADTDPNQTTFDDDDDDDDDTPVKLRALKKLLPKAINHFTNIIGLEIVDVDLSGFGQSPVSTCRVVSRNKEGPSRSKSLSFNIPSELCTQLADIGVPFALQSMLDVGSSKAKGSVRLVVFDPSFVRISGRSGFGRHVYEDHPYDLHGLVSRVNLTTNYRMSIRDYWHIRYNPETPGLNAYSAHYTKKVRDPDYRYRQTKEQADRIRRLVTGTAEFVRLKRCDDNYHELYEKLGYYPRFNLKSPQFSYFFAVPPIYYQISPWDRIAYRSRPKIITRKIVREAPGTTQAVGLDLEHADASSEEESEIISESISRIQNDGSDEHYTGGIFAVNYIEEQGLNAEELDQDSSSIPDFRISTIDGKLPPLQRRIGPRPESDEDDATADMDEEYIAILPNAEEIDTEIVEGEVERSFRSKAANMLDNAARAAMQNRAVIFVFSNRDDAKKGMEYLDTPYKKPTDDGRVPLHQSTRDITLEDGSTPVHRGSQTRWELTGPRTLSGSDGQKTITTGDANESIDTFDFDCPRYRRTDGKYVVFDTDGQEVAEYHSKDRLTDDWTTVRKPHVPIGHTYLPRSILMYRDGDELRLYEPDPEWDGPDAMDRHKGMFEATVDRLLIEEDGAELEVSEFRRRINQIYHRKTDWYPPTPNVSGQVRKEVCPDIETKRRNNPSRTFLKDRRWIYDPEIVSPDLPGYDRYMEDD